MNPFRHCLKLIAAGAWVMLAGCEATQESVSDQPIARFSYAVDFARYSPQLDRIVIASKLSRSLHIVNPLDGSDKEIELFREPLSLAISPDGQFAAVGEDAQLAYVDLKNARVQTSLTTTLSVDGVAVTDTGLIYATEAHVDVGIEAWDAATGQHTTLVPRGWLESGLRQLYLDPHRQALYAPDYDVGLVRIDLSGSDFSKAPVSEVFDSQGGFNSMWLSSDGTRAFMSTGEILNLPRDKMDDGSHAGQALSYGWRPGGKNAAAPRMGAQHSRSGQRYRPSGL